MDTLGHTGSLQVLPSQGLTLSWKTSGSRTSRRLFHFERHNQPNWSLQRDRGSEKVSIQQGVKSKFARHPTAAPPHLLQVSRSHVGLVRSLALLYGVTVGSFVGWWTRQSDIHSRTKTRSQKQGWKNEDRARDPRDGVSETSQSGQPERLDSEGCRQFPSTQLTPIVKRWTVKVAGSPVTGPIIT